MSISLKGCPKLKINYYNNLLSTALVFIVLFLSFMCECRNTGLLLNLVVQCAVKQGHRMLLIANYLKNTKSTLF